MKRQKYDPNGNCKIENGFTSTDTNDVLDKWRNSFSELYNPVIHAHREEILDQYNMSDFIQSYPCNFDEPLTLTESS